MGCKKEEGETRAGLRNRPQIIPKKNVIVNQRGKISGGGSKGI